MEAGALVIFALLVLFAFLGLGVWATVKAVGAAKRGVDRTITQARRTVEDTTLRARSLGQVGVTAGLAQLRLDLRTSMRATQQALYQGVQTDGSLRESIGLFERLSEHGHELDAELKRLEQEPDRKRIAAALPDLRARTRKITESADSLRWAARERARRFAEDDLSALSAQIEVESGALRDWSRESVEDLTAAAASREATEPAEPERRADGPTEPAPAALNPATRAPRHPWEKTPGKTPRPETTA
ncbi:hypothetical protein GCM10010347_06560 [Streptomyces cirratus]|uniref:Secreted protein n=1 Tax=Streptomyces cirratus TaxID=68187 RepID=A0ABQ3EHN1_9ACTN|nr:hypothetical protein [Streptomyces cirratus]GHB39754.1 hypothetical protein GCM10010347_06560 [Streptomyces cirratus]